MNSMCLRFTYVSLCAALSLSAHAAPAGQAALKSGEEVFNTVCTACHSTGVAHAPKFKDKEAWAPLIAEGQAVLTAHAWVGVRAMPAMGGNPDLRLEEFARGVVWMTRHAGSNWSDPDARMMRAISREAEKRLDESIREAQAMKKALHRMNAAPR